MMLVQAISGPINVQISCLSGQLTGISTRLTGVETKLADQGSRLTSLETRVQDMERKGHAGTGGASIASMSDAGGGGDDNPYSNPMVPRHLRTVLIVGGFDQDAPKEFRERHIRTLTAGFEAGIDDLWAPGKFLSIGKVRFVDTKKLWAFIKAKRGTTYGVDGRKIWWTIEKTNEERKISKAVTTAVNDLRRRLVESNAGDEEAAKNLITGDWDRGIVYAQIGGVTFRVVEKVRSSIKFTLLSRFSQLGFVADSTNWIDWLNSSVDAM